MEERFENEEVEVIDVEAITPEESGSGTLGKVLLGAAVVGAGCIAGYIFKHKEEFKAKRLMKKAEALEKAGCTVLLPGDDFEDDVVEEKAEVVEEKSEAKEETNK